MPHIRHLGRTLLLGLVCIALALAGPTTEATGRQAPAEPVQSLGPAAAPDGFAPDRLLARPTAGASADAVAAAVATAGARQVRRVAGIGVLVLEVPAAARERALATLAASPAFAVVEHDPVVGLLERIPNDPMYPEQWGAELVRAPEAWATTVGVDSATVAVLDTGVDASHEDLDGAVMTERGYDFVGDDADASDDQGHGTEVAGVAAARGDNNLGGAGTCWRCSVLPVKVLDDQGRGVTSDVASGIVYAADQGAEVINLSLGTTQRSEALALAVSYAEERGALLVAAAGNAGSEDPVYPAAFDVAVGVAATDEDDGRYGWSSFGDWVDVAAPGCNLATDFDPTRRYSWFCGTSSATPIVAGLAGLSFSTDAAPDHGQVRAALQDSSVAVGPFVRHGRVDAAGTMAALLPPPGEPEPSPTPTPPDDVEPTPTPAPPAEEIEPSPAPTETEPPIEPEPVPGVATERLAGADRFRTAEAISSWAFPPDVRRVYLATGSAFPDALTAGAAASRYGGPVLLVNPTTLPEATERELRRLRPQEVVVVGGRAAVSDAVVERAAAVTEAPTRRVAGPSRFDTATAVALDAFAEAPVVHVATGVAFPDALAGVPAAAEAGGPLLLVAPDAVPEATAAALRQLRPRRIVILGGPAAVSTAVGDELRRFASDGVVRVSGKDRFATAAAVADRAFPGESATGFVATGLNFPDALAGGPAAAASRGPLLLVLPDDLPAPAAGQLRRLAPHTVAVLGGKSAVSESTAQAAAQAASEGSPE